jgi:C-terminal processing protease CtpA/Prc
MRLIDPLSLKPTKIIMAFLILYFAPMAYSQATIGFERQRAIEMLKTVKSDLKKNYYDINLRGMDIDTRFKEAEEKIKQATTVGMMHAIIAQAVVELNDSHTRYIPPSRAAKFEYGWLMQMIGDKCFITSVKPGSDAAAKGLKAGDQILAIDGYAPSRKILWKIIYRYYNLIREPVLTLPRLKHVGFSFSRY